MPTPFNPKGCRDALAAALLEVDGIGVVHKQRKIVRTETAIKQYLFDQVKQRICGWMISPASSTTTVAERNPGHHGIGTRGGGNDFTTVQWQIEGFFGLDESKDSETVFTDLVWDVVEGHLNRYGMLAIQGITHQLPANVETFGYTMFAGTPLLHYARIGIGFRGRPAT
jgi:hypothetical protein